MEPASFGLATAANTSNGHASQSLSLRSASRVASDGAFGVDLHRHGDLAVPQDAHGDSRMDVERGQQRGTGLAGAMDGDPGYPGGDDATVEAAAEVARLDWRTVPGGEDQAGIYPAVSRTVAVDVLLCLADLERGHTQVRQRPG